MTKIVQINSSFKFYLFFQVIFQIALMSKL